MPEQTTSWYCDSCGEPITEARHGYVEWIDQADEQGQRPRGHNLRIVHSWEHSPHGPGRCQYNPARVSASGGAVADDALTTFQGPDGLARLLGMVEDGDLPCGEVAEILRRIHVPGYEQARQHFGDELAADAVADSAGRGYWTQEALQEALDAVRVD